MYEINIFFRLDWQDLRLNYAMYYEAQKISVHHSLMNKIWKPDPFFVNEKQAVLHHVPEPNKCLHVLNTGEVEYSVRLTLKLSCTMNLRKFPMDVQICSVKMQSCKYENGYCC